MGKKTGRNKKNNNNKGREPVVRLSEEERISRSIQPTYRKSQIRRSSIPYSGDSDLSLPDLWIAHVGGSLPVRNENGKYVLQTAYSFGRKDHTRIPINGTVIDMDFTDPRNTKHFTINCVVESHNARNESIYIDSRKYGIVVSDAKRFIEDNDIIDTKSIDLVVLGNATLEDFILFVPSNEQEQFKQKYPDIHLEPYDGDIEDSMKRFVVDNLKKPLMRYSPMGWIDEMNDIDKPNEQALMKICAENGFPWLQPYLFQATPYDGLEMSRRMAIMVIELIKKINEMKIEMPAEKIHEMIDYILIMQNMSGVEAYGSYVTNYYFMRGVYEIFKDKGISIPEGFYAKAALSSGNVCKELNESFLACSKIGTDIVSQAKQGAITDEAKEPRKDLYGNELKFSYFSWRHIPGYVLCLQPSFMHEGTRLIIQKLLERTNGRPGVQEMLDAGFISPELNKHLPEGVEPGED